MHVGAEATEGACHEFAQPRRCIKAHHEAGKHCHIEGFVEVKVGTQCQNELYGVWAVFLPL